jgi:hypothetical protein
MGLFSLDYKNMPGQCVYARGGLKFRADENALQHYFAPILPCTSLNDLIGEAVFWILLPSTVAIWTFPLVFYRADLIIVTLALYVLARILHMSIYLKSLNYLVFIFCNPLLQFLFYTFLVIVFILNSSIISWEPLPAILFLAAIFLFFHLGGDDFQFGLLMLLLVSHSWFRPFTKKFLYLPPSDQILWNVGRFYRKKLGIKPMKMLRKNYPIQRTKEYF